MPSSLMIRLSVFCLLGDNSSINARQSMPICYKFFLSSTLTRKHSSSTKVGLTAKWTTPSFAPSLPCFWTSKHLTIKVITPSRTCQLACYRSFTVLLTKTSGWLTLIRLAQQFNVMSRMDYLLSLSFSMRYRSRSA